jgi:hypothetical protein
MVLYSFLLYPPSHLLALDARIYLVDLCSVSFGDRTGCCTSEGLVSRSSRYSFTNAYSIVVDGDGVAGGSVVVEWTRQLFEDNGFVLQLARIPEMEYVGEETRVETNALTEFRGKTKVPVPQTG